jgi:hypothetical protein
MRMRLAWIVLLTVAGSAAADPPALRERCLAAIDGAGVPAERSALKETLSVPISAHQHLFQFTGGDGAVFSCQLCDDANPQAQCPPQGIDLAYRPAGGELRRLPAELDRKCVLGLVRELGPPEARMTIRHDLVARTVVQARHSDSRWVYELGLDDVAYRCVIRRSDGSFRIERRDGPDDWHALAAGTLY